MPAWWCAEASELAYDTPNVSPFLGNSFIYNGGPSGAQGNPIGANPVGTLTLNNYTLRRPARRSIGRGTAFTICSP